MNFKENAAALSVIINFLLTIFKYCAYLLTGSIAIFAEVIHSFSDIITSILVFISVKKRKKIPPPKELLKKMSLLQKIQNISLEHKISFFIGVLILLASFGVIEKVFYSSVPNIESPLIGGICFLFFAFGSYILYKYESNIGKKEKSNAIESDGMHSKADMISALLTGISLIIYKLGFDIDKPVAFIISLLIFIFGIETLITVLIALFKKEEYVDFYKSSIFFEKIFSKNFWKICLHFFEKKTGYTFSKKMIKICGVILIFSIVAVTLKKAFIFVVNPSEEALIERFGKIINNKSISSGLHFKLPWPIDKIIIVDSKKIKNLNIGNIEINKQTPLLWTREHGSEEPFLTGDNNFFYPYISLHYVIKNVYTYYKKNKNNKKILENIAYKTATKIFSTTNFYDVVTIKRKKISELLKNNIQQELNKYETGIELLSVNLKDIHPPIFISDVFEDVIAAMQDKEKYINQAYSYRNYSIPIAKSKAYHIISNSNLYVKKIINKAQGETDRFLSKLNFPKKNESIVKKMILFETLKETIFEPTNIIVDPKTGIPEIWSNFFSSNVSKSLSDKE